MTFFKNIPIRFKLFIAYSVVFLVILPGCFAVLFFKVQAYLEERIEQELNLSNQTITDMVETSATVSIKNHLRAIAEKNREILTWIYREVETGRMMEDQAKAKAVGILMSQSVGDTGYIYCINSKGVAVVHPEDGVRGRDFSHRKFIQTQIREKTGYVEYDWKNPGDKATRPKALYMAYFEPWDWIISVSSYKSEFTRLISIRDFEEQITRLKFGESGYCFVIDSHGNAVIHPELSGNILDIQDANGLSLAREIIRMKKGSLTYFWKNPSETVPREKFVAFDYIPAFDWIIASSTYTSEAFAPLGQVRNAFLGLLVVSLVFAGGLTLLVGISITRSMEAVIDRFERGGHGDWASKISVDRKDEIGRLSVSFNRFIDQMDSYRNDLVSEIHVRRTVENQLRLFEKVFENTSEGICITDKNGAIQAVNKAFTEITGYEAHEVMGANPRVLKSNRHPDGFYREMWQRLSEKGYWAGEIWNRRKSGEAYPELLSISAIREGDNVNKYVAVFHDISDMKVKEQQIEHLAFHDPLTNLPNRLLFKDRLGQTISEARRSGEMIQVLFLDLDNFKNVNDTVGHAKGDELLKETAARLLSVTRSADTVSRMGGDEFTIMIPHIKSPEEVAKTVRRVQSAFDDPFILGDHSFHVTASIGVSLFPNDGGDEETLTKNADLAMYQTKHQSKNSFSIFEQEMAEKVSDRVTMEMDLRAGIDNDEILVYFQPRVDSGTRKITGMEALARWQKPGKGLVAPDQFIPLAEASGLIVPLGEKVFFSSMKQAQEIRKATGLDLSVSVNVSPRQFEDVNFETMVRQALEQTGFPGNRLEIEITESILLKDMDMVMARLEQLAETGARIAIDDFGTGYSSLAYIKKLPISILKIDKTFIDDLPSSQDARTIVETTVLMAQKLNIDIVAEGVETEEQLAILCGLGQMEIQGYLFARPMEADELPGWIGGD